jgi:hypothetical protein
MKIKLIFVTVLFVTFSFGQNDSISRTQNLLNDKIINYLEIQINNLEKNYFEVKSILLDSFAIQDKTNKYVDSTITSQNESLKDISIRLESISTKLDTISISYSSKLIMLERLINENYEKNLIKQSSLLQSISEENKKTDRDFESLNISLNSKSQLNYLLFSSVFVMVLCLFYFLRKRVSLSTSKLESEQLKLDEKLINLYESKLTEQKQQIVNNSNNDIDHSLAIKVGDEIIRMQKNITNMPHETRGLKQLTKALQRIKDTFKLNGYEMIEMLNKPYNDGMKVVANFVTDDSLESGQQIITRIIKPQINYNGIMIQSAQIEVSVGE